MPHNENTPFATSQNTAESQSSSPSRCNSCFFSNMSQEQKFVFAITALVMTICTATFIGLVLYFLDFPSHDSNVKGMNTSPQLGNN